ncbi:MAG: ASCH domain-containing protein [Candidatus Caccosoma sp.]|nr:ASCH domain-containing protein [Candidatus Caccosoma sp.]
MNEIILSIKPEYANKIFDGTKKYEFRKRIAKKEISKIIVYSSSPVHLIVGEVKVIGVLSLKPSLLWKLTKNESGISKTKFIKYFKKCKIAYAYMLGEVKKYDIPKALIDFNIKQAPQSFIYVNKK